jgi:uncharacterized membrane-anchored protein
MEDLIIAILQGLFEFALEVRGGSTRGPRWRRFAKLVEVLLVWVAVAFEASTHGLTPT